jgi:uncharacterized protein YbgA (DUF1722 family)/uncharacterized protein YbbK (DUF523 family)
MTLKLKLGVSRCLMGDPVRYDGMHKHDHFLTDTLGQYVEYVPVCPEVEIGLTIPREAMRLVGDPAAPRLMTQKTGIDYSERMTAWAQQRVRDLEQEGLCGFIFKAKSPSSGMERVKVYNAKGVVEGRAPGMFARVFMEHFPLLPVEDEARLNDPGLRENFIERIFTLHRYRDMRAADRSLRGLMEFQARHKLLLMSHSDKAMRDMGRLLAQAPRAEVDRTAAAYERLLLQTLQLKSTVTKHINVLHHMLGYFKDLLSADEKREMLAIIEAYRGELVPLIVPVTLFNHYARKYRVSTLVDQAYLNPHPLELKLRNHA